MCIIIIVVDDPPPPWLATPPPKVAHNNVGSLMESCLNCCHGGPPPPRDAWLGRSAFTLTKRTCCNFWSFQIDLTWDKCGPLFDFFKPKNMPEFDSLKTNTVSTEVCVSRSSFIYSAFILHNSQQNGPCSRYSRLHGWPCCCCCFILGS